MGMVSLHYFHTTWKFDANMGFLFSLLNLISQQPPVKTISRLPQGKIVLSSEKKSLIFHNFLEMKSYYIVKIHLECMNSSDIPALACKVNADYFCATDYRGQKGAPHPLDVELTDGCEPSDLGAGN